MRTRQEIEDDVECHRTFMEVLLDIRDYLAEREKPQSPSLTGTTSVPNLPVEVTNVSTPLFKARDIRYTWIDYGESWGEDALVFKSKEQAEQAIEALLKLTQ